MHCDSDWSKVFLLILLWNSA